MACAYIWNESNVLMLKKASQGTLFPNLWVPVGGHIEPEEATTPKAACLREIEEETGLSGNQLTNIKEKYITIRRKHDEIRFQHIFVCHTESHEVIDSDEGKLAWIPEEKLLGLEMSITNRMVLKHYFSSDRDTDDLFMGIVDASESKLVWVKLDSLDTPF